MLVPLHHPADELNPQVIKLVGVIVCVELLHFQNAYNLSVPYYFGILDGTVA